MNVPVLHSPLAALRQALQRGLIMALVVGVAGCASLPDPGPRPVSEALPTPLDTSVGRMTMADAPNARHSGFRLVASGEEALGSLVTLADRAERTLDLQYYIVHPDGSSRAIFERVAAAAQRGVRVRLLIDDMNTAGYDDLLLLLDNVPNVEVRVYNPFPGGRASILTRLMASLNDFARINHRMHNKMFVADNALALTGGRNLGDAYFLRSEESNFLDLDVLVAGPAVRQLSATFDRFWNSKHAYPIGALVRRPASAGPADAATSPADVAAAPIEAPAQGRSAVDAVEVARPPERPMLADQIEQGKLPLVWAPATLIADGPAKIESEGDPEEHETLADDVRKLVMLAQRDLVLISPYLVPGQRGVQTLKELRERGVRIRVLTNSLAATDATAVHIGYSRYREEMLKLGIEIHELRAHPSPARSGKWGVVGSSAASLHVKALVIDGRLLLVGSMNLDPRSAYLNTEQMLAVRSRTLAEQTLRLYETAAEEACYRVDLDEQGRLRWQDDEGHIFDVEPETSWWLRTGLKLLAPFAPDEML